MWMQAEGLPIGGPHSPACCSVVLGADGARWAAGADRRAALGFGGADDVLEAKAAYARYVDDLCVISKVWCESCLGTMVSAMYRKPVQFDCQASSEIGQPWLDMWISFANGELQIHMGGQEQEWVQRLAAAPPSKMRLKPYLRDVACSTGVLRLHVSARMARLRQAVLEEPALRRAVERELFVLALHGYPRAMLRRAWARCPQYPAASQYTRAASWMRGTMRSQD